MTATAPPPFLLAISGSRSIHRPDLVLPILDQAAAEILCMGRELHIRVGDAGGVDSITVGWAREYSIPRHICFASREKWGLWKDMHIHHPTLPAWVAHIWDSQADPPTAGWRTPADRESAELSSDWEREGLTLAGSKRNAAILYGHPLGLNPQPRADRLLAIHDGVSPGTETCIRQAEMMGIPVQYELVIG